MPTFEDSPAPSAARVAYERSFVGAAIVHPVAGALLVAKARLDDFLDPLAFRVFLVLVWYVKATNYPVRAPATDLERVIEDLSQNGDLRKLGGREAVETLVADRPELREALAALRAAAARSENTSA